LSFGLSLAPIVLVLLPEREAASYASDAHGIRCLGNPITPSTTRTPLQLTDHRFPDVYRSFTIMADFGAKVPCARAALPCFGTPDVRSGPQAGFHGEAVDRETFAARPFLRAG